MKYRCIKDLKGLGLLTVGKIYDIVENRIYGFTIFSATNDYGREINFSYITLPKYFEKVENQ